MGATVMVADSTSSVALSGVLGAALGAVATVLVVFLTPMATRRDRYDAVLLERRMRAYDRLWEILEPTSRYAQRHRVPIDVGALELALTQWYYRDGHGLYGTPELRDLVVSLRDSLSESTDPEALDRDAVFELASGLRSEMTRDLNSRQALLRRGVGR